MENNKAVSVLVPLIDVWVSPQVGLREVIRWKKYLHGEPGVRMQDSLQHTLSIGQLAFIMLAAMHIEGIDALLLIRCILFHDNGEGIIGRDTLYIDKSVSGDLAEYAAFCEKYRPLGIAVFSELQRAFLLQFARKNPKEFPEDARAIMAELAGDYEKEAVLFDIIERFDYVLYALEQYLERGNIMILVQTLRHQVEHLDRLAGKVRAFGELFWTAELSEWAQELLAMHAGEWIETKSVA